MPLYEYLCSCGKRSESYRRMAESASPNLCPSCGELARRIISPVRVFGDFEGYESPTTGKWIEGKRARLEDLKRSGCRPYEDGEREEAVRRNDAYWRRVDAAVDREVDKAVEGLPLDGSDERLARAALAYTQEKD